MIVPILRSGFGSGVGLALGLAAHTVLGATPLAAATPARSADVVEPANDPTGQRIVVSIEQRRLWLISGKDTLFTAPVAVGRTGTFTYRGETYRWATPKGTRRVLAKEPDPVWVPPEWHYFEKAARRGLEPVKLERGQEYRLSDGSYLEVRGDQVVFVNRFGKAHEWTPGKEIIFDGKIFIPPLDTVQRQVPNALGTHALDIGNGYLIHGTWEGNRSSIGTYASHGCIRMYNEDIRKLYGMVDVGVPVQII